jgi:hypothetical protein
VGLARSEGYTLKVSIKPKNPYRPSVEPSKKAHPVKTRELSTIERDIVPPTDDEVMAVYMKSIVSASLARDPTKADEKTYNNRWGQPLPISLNREQSLEFFPPKKDEPPAPVPVVTNKWKRLGVRRRLSKLQTQERHREILKFIDENPEMTLPQISRKFNMDKNSLRNLCEKAGVAPKPGRPGNPRN